MRDFTFSILTAPYFTASMHFMKIEEFVNCRSLTCEMVVQGSMFYSLRSKANFF